MAVPDIADAIRITFPDTEVSVGSQVAVSTRWMAGQPLHAMLYQRDSYDSVLSFGMAALSALKQADLSSAPFSVASRIFRLTRGPKVVLAEMLSRGILTTDERSELRRLIAGYMSEDRRRRSLIHGDLQPAHLLVDLETRTLGFIDLEAMCLGKAATNFAQLWIGFHFADEALGRRLWECYQARWSDEVGREFETDVKAEIALRCYSHIKVGRRSGKEEMRTKARALIRSALSGAELNEVCRGAQ